MTEDELAALLLDSIARHQSRGIVYGDAASGSAVVHGRIDLAAVASDLGAMLAIDGAARSWSGWFASRVHARRRREAAQDRHLAQVQEREARSAAALERLRLRGQRSH